MNIKTLHVLKTGQELKKWEKFNFLIIFFENRIFLLMTAYFVLEGISQSIMDIGMNCLDIMQPHLALSMYAFDYRVSQKKVDSLAHKNFNFFSQNIAPTHHKQLHQPFFASLQGQQKHLRVSQKRLCTLAKRQLRVSITYVWS